MASAKGAGAADHGALLALLSGLVNQPVQLQLTDRTDPVSGVLVAVSPGGVVLQQEYNLLAVRPGLVTGARERPVTVATETVLAETAATPETTDTEKAARDAPTATTNPEPWPTDQWGRPALPMQMLALPIQGGQPDADEPLPDLVDAEHLLPAPPAAVPPPPRLHQFPRLWEPETPGLRHFRRPL